MSPHVLARGRGHISFATARWTSSSLYAGVCLSSSTVYFTYSSADIPTVRMSTLSLLFVLALLMLLALESLSLSQIVVLVLNHTPMIHAVVLFLIVEINLRVTKLLLFPTATAAAV